MAKKKAKKKTKRKKSKQHKPKAPHKPRALGLHYKKLSILREVPLMPCSAISKDRHGLMYAHTQATDVYNRYREKCQEYDLTIRRTEGRTSNIKYPDIFKRDDKWVDVSVEAVLFEGIWEIRDNETGQSETFGGSGIGNNEVWSANSAQTVARKQALLDYFETAWPQPADWCRVVREELEKLKGENFTKALKQIMPAPAYQILTATQAIKEMEECYSKGTGKCSKPQKSRKSR